MSATGGARGSKSTPATCQQQLISRLLLPVNEQQLRRYCTESLTRICHEYEVSQDMAVVCQLRESVSDMSLTSTLALFFLLLNIDSGLKRAVMDSEPAGQQGKCVNFYMNLRRHVIPEFLSSEACDVIRFVTRCEDAWGVA
jgi:hypothetical protein